MGASKWGSLCGAPSWPEACLPPDWGPKLAALAGQEALRGLSGSQAGKSMRKTPLRLPTRSQLQLASKTVQVAAQRRVRAEADQVREI